jgi:hypothetical protein
MHNSLDLTENDYTMQLFRNMIANTYGCRKRENFVPITMTLLVCGIWNDKIFSWKNIFLQVPSGIVDSVYNFLFQKIKTR